MLQLKKNKGAKAGVVAASLVAIGSIFGVVQRQATQSTPAAANSVVVAAQTPITARNVVASSSGSTGTASTSAKTTTTTKTTNTRTHVS